MPEFDLWPILKAAAVVGAIAALLAAWGIFEAMAWLAAHTAH